MNNEPWYKDGLRFACTQCGNCCSGQPGFVWVNDEEITRIAQFTGRSEGEIRLDHVRSVGRRQSLTEFSNGDCTFLDGKTRRCQIYPVRPRQCRTWPFWNSNLESPESWDAARQVCPGAGHGTLYSLEVINTQAAVIPL